MSADRMPTICLGCNEAIPATEYVEHRRHCQADIEADNARRRTHSVRETRWFDAQAGLEEIVLLCRGCGQQWPFNVARDVLEQQPCGVRP